MQMVPPKASGQIAALLVRVVAKLAWVFSRLEKNATWRRSVAIVFSGLLHLLFVIFFLSPEGGTSLLGGKGSLDDGLDEGVAVILTPLAFPIPQENYEVALDQATTVDQVGMPEDGDRDTEIPLLVSNHNTLRTYRLLIRT
jgi:hypothetical protein